MSREVDAGGPLFEADSALIYLTASELPNVLLMDSIAMTPVTRRATRLSTRILDGRNTLAFLRPASTQAIRQLIDEATDDEVIAIRVAHPLRLAGARRHSDDLAELPPLVGLAHISSVLYRSPEQASRIRTNLRLSGTDPKALEHTVVPGAFDGDVHLTQEHVARLGTAMDPRVAEQIRFFERVVGALLAGPAAEVWLEPTSPYGQTLSTLGGAAWVGTDPRVAATELRLHGVESLDPNASALLWATGVIEPLPMHPWRSNVDTAYRDADARVAEAAYKTVLSADESTVPTKSLLEAIVRSVENVDASHGTGLIDRYRKAAELVESVNTNKRRLDQVMSLPTWHQGFESLQALLLLGTAKDDEFERVWARSALEGVTPRARSLARSLFGAAFGIRAIPQERRPALPVRKAAHEFVERLVNHVFSHEPLSVVREGSASGRGNKRVFHLSVEVLGQDFPISTTAAQRKAAEVVSRIAFLTTQEWSGFAEHVKRQPKLRRHIHHSWSRPTGVREVNDGRRWVGGPEDDALLIPEPFVPDWESFSRDVFEFLASSDAKVINSWKRALDRLNADTK